MQRNRRLTSHRALALVAGIVAIVAAVGLTIGGGAAGRMQDATPAASPIGSPAASPVATPAGGGEPVTIVGVDIAWEYQGERSAPNQPVEVAVAPGQTISLPNEGAALHNFAVEAFGDVVVDMPVGETVEYTVPADVAPGEYEFICTIPGHVQAGMIGVLIVG